MTYRFDSIVEAVAVALELCPEAIRKGGDRSPHMVEARSMVSWIARRFNRASRRSWQFIADKLGYACHTSAYDGFLRIERELLHPDEDVSPILLRVEELLNK